MNPNPCVDVPVSPQEIPCVTDAVTTTIPTVPNQGQLPPNQLPAINGPAKSGLPTLPKGDDCLRVDASNTGQTRWTMQPCQLTAVGSPPVVSVQAVRGVLPSTGRDVSPQLGGAGLLVAVGIALAFTAKRKATKIS